MKSFIQNPKALIVAPPWAGLIVTGEKDWEMRSRATSTRGIIAIAEKGAKRLLGLVTLDRCSGPHTQTALLQNINHHRGTTEDIMQPGFKYHYAWELSNAIEFPAPIPYTPKSGAVSWVNLSTEVAQQILQVLNSDIPMQHTDITAKAATSTISTPAPTPTIVQPQPTPAPSQTNFSSNNYVGTMVPIAKDGSVFHPHHCLRNGQYRVGEKGAIKTFVDFAEALKYLTEMKTATWLRPNPKGNGKGKGTWGGVKAVEWTPLQLETE